MYDLNKEEAKSWVMYIKPRWPTSFCYQHVVIDGVKNCWKVEKAEKTYFISLVS